MKTDKVMNILCTLAITFFFVFLMNSLMVVFKADKRQIASELIAIQKHNQGMK